MAARFLAASVLAFSSINAFLSGKLAHTLEELVVISTWSNLLDWLLVLDHAAMDKLIKIMSMISFLMTLTY